LTPLQRYHRDIDNNKIISDPAQKEAVDELQILFERLQRYFSQSLLAKFKRLFNLSKTPKGIYFWGKVGRGKTYLMDLFYDALQNPNNITLSIQRLHFHRFMFWLHQQLKSHRGEADPLKKIANDFAKKYQVLCFDEFFVSEIGDAMLLGKLFKTLFEKGVVLVTTSNIPPQKLYWKGFHRERFLVTIDLIQNNTLSFNLDGDRDYRLRALTKMEVFYNSNNENTPIELQSCYQKLKGPEPIVESTQRDHILISEREIKIVAATQQLLWIEFEPLCEGERSTLDYIEIARLYPTIILSGIPQLSDKKVDAVRRFISFIDEIYDHGVKLILSAQVDIVDLYGDNELAFEFQRTQSRLHEMQTQQYLAKKHTL